MSSAVNVAKKLIQAWREGVWQSSSDLRLDSEADAYLVQAMVASELEWFVGSGPNFWKLGGTPGNLVSTAQVPPDAIHPSGWKVTPGYCERYGIESELIIRLGRDLNSRADLSQAHDAVDAWYVGIELCDTRFVNGECVDPLLRLADRQLNRALIIGDEVRPSGNWGSQSVELRIDGSIVKQEKGGHPFLDPLLSVPWLARHAAARGHSLKAGDLVATGSWTGLVWAPPGSVVHVEFVGLGAASLSTP